jgi:hypothetical protein
LGLAVMPKIQKELAEFNVTIDDVYRQIVSESIHIFTDRNDTFSRHYYQGECMLFNALVRGGCVTIKEDGMIDVDYSKGPASVNVLADDMIKLQSQLGDADIDEKAAAFKAKWFDEGIYEKVAYTKGK